MSSLQKRGSVWVLLSVCYRGTLHGWMLVALWSTSLLIEMGAVHLAQSVQITLVISCALLLDYVHLNLKVSK